MATAPLDPPPHPSVEGDKAEIDDLLQEHLPVLLGYIRLHADPSILAHESCEDLLQTVCREALEHRLDFQFRGPEAFRAWLFRLALNKIQDRRRYIHALKRDPAREVYISHVSSNSRIAHLYRPFFSPSQAASQKEDVERLERCLHQLPPDYQKVIICARLMEMSYEEVALEMNRSVGAVRTLVHRALGQLGLLMYRQEQGLTKD